MERECINQNENCHMLSLGQRYAPLHSHYCSQHVVPKLPQSLVKVVPKLFQCCHTVFPLLSQSRLKVVPKLTKGAVIEGVAVGRVGGQLSEFDLAEVDGIASYLKAVFKLSPVVPKCCSYSSQVVPSAKSIIHEKGVDSL